MNDFFNPFGGEQEPQCLEINASNKNGWKNKVGNDGGGPWNAHWENFSGKKFDKQLCSREYCFDPAEVGAHVIRPSDGSKEWITPFCQEHNVKENLPNVPAEYFDLKVGTILVYADA